MPSIPGVRVVSRPEVREWLSSGSLWRHLFRYRQATIRTHRIEFMTKPVLAGIMLRLLSRGHCFVEDETGQRVRLTWTRQFQWLARCARDGLRKPTLLARVRARLRALEQLRQNRGLEGPDLARPPLYLRTDFCFGLQSGGSVGHTAGVLNQLEQIATPPIFIATTPIPTVAAHIETHIVHPADRFLDFNELPLFHYNETLLRAAQRILAGRRISFVYQRYSLNNYAGVELAREQRVPLVLEYNGSDVWVSDHWGTPLTYRALSEAVEAANLRSADLVVVVSRVLQDELLGRGVDPRRILINPNGVDPAVYHPGIDGGAVRERYALGGKTVLGFIGTFGRWHGAEVLVEAFGRLLQQKAALRSSIRLLMIGDGQLMPEVRRRIEQWGVQDAMVLTGLVPQAEGPAHLAACDILVSPHVPNPDGSPFFGSPTKLFEYMAMGRAIVASDLEQVGEILDHGETGWLVLPGSPEALADGLLRLIDDPELRLRLGRAARRRAEEQHTWVAHTQRIVDALQGLSPKEKPR